MVFQIEVNHITGSILFIYDKQRHDDLLQLVEQLSIDEFTPVIPLTENDKSYELMQKNIKDHYFKNFGILFFKRYFVKWLLPLPFQRISCFIMACQYFKKELHSLKKGKINVRNFGNID